MTPHLVRWVSRALFSLSLWWHVPIARSQESIDAPQASQATTDADHAPSNADISQALARYRREPPVSHVIDAAIRHQQIRPGRVADLASRARTAGWVPTVRLSARRGQTIDLLAAQTTTTDRNSASSGDDLVLEAQLVFDLSKAVWSNNELRVEREMRAERQARQAAVQLVTHLYFERRRLQVERDLADTPDVTSAIRIVEIEGLLDGFTGGEFSRALKQRAR